MVDATYVVNVPILKRHAGNGVVPVTLAFKNHCGSLDRIVGSDNDNICKKTVLTLRDGLFGALGVADNAAMSWTVLGDPANSLFFATDPVASDCVTADFIVAHGLVTKAHAYDCPFYASQVGLGQCEGTRASPGGNLLQWPYGSGYTTIQYVRVEM